MLSEFTIKCKATVTGTITVVANNESEAWDIAVGRSGEEIDATGYSDCEPQKVINKCEYIAEKGE